MPKDEPKPTSRRNLKRDLDKVEKCAECGKDFPRSQMRGANPPGTWLCEEDFEERYGYLPDQLPRRGPARPSNPQAT